MALQVWLPLNKDTNVIPDITGFTKEGSIILTADSDGWYKVADSSHTSSRWGIYKDFTVKPDTQYTLCVYSKSTTGVTAAVAVGSFIYGTIGWPSNIATNATSTEKLTTYTWKTGNKHVNARVYLNIACSSTVTNNYVFFKDPVIYEDFSNQGLANITASNYNASVNNNGKIGKCYSLVNGQYIKLNNLSFSSLTNCSISLWIKITGKGSSGWLPFSGQSQYQYILATRSGTGAFYHGSVGSTTKIVYCDGVVRTTPVNDNNWHHYCVTGINLSSWTAFYINNYFEYPTSWNFSGSVNDVRIYDHCLSPKEVKEISKGLVLHYKFDDPAITLKSKLTNVNYNLLVNLNSSGYTYTFSNNYSLYYIQIANLNTPITTVSGHKYYTRAYISRNISGNNGVYYQLVGAGGNAAIFASVSNGSPDGYYSYIKTVTEARSNSTYLGIGNYLLKGHFDVGDTVTIKDIVCVDLTDMFGAGNEPTKEEFELLYLYASTTYNPGTVINLKEPIYDCSGYQNNATTNGTILSSLNSPRYDYCVKYPNSACSIGIGNLSTIVPEKVFTFNIWFKKVTGEWSSKNWETIFGGPSGFEIESKRSSTNSPKIVIYNWGGSSDSTKDIPYDLDVWNMLTMVRTTSNTKFYLNGELKITGTAGSVPSGNYFIGSWATATSLNYRGYFSDARIYATVLSDADILELYNTSAIIDDHGNSYCYLFTDNYELGEFTKLGIGKFDLIENEQLQSSIYKEVKPNLLSGTYPGIPKKTMTTSTTEFGTLFNPTELLLTGVNYTISMRIRGTAPMNIYTINTGGNYSFGFLTRDLITTDYQLLKLTFKVTGDRTINQIYICTKWGNTLSGEWFEVEPYSIKLEEGNTCTPWIPAETDDMYRSYGKTLLSNELIEI